MALKRTSYKDEEGRLKAVFLPDSEHDANAFMGVPIGPPDLSKLGLPLESEVRLSNELFHRGVLTAQDALKKRADIQAAIQATLKIDTEKIVALYVGEDYRNAKAPEVKPNKTLQHRRPRKSRKQS